MECGAVGHNIERDPHRRITFKSSPLKPLNQITLNLAGMVVGWIPFKNVSDSPALHFKISSPLFSIFRMAGSRDHRTQFWKGPSKDHSTKVWLQLAQWFLRRRLKCEIWTDGRRTKSDDNSSHGLKAR
jgi:hypothetical protein